MSLFADFKTKVMDGVPSLAMSILNGFITEAQKDTTTFMRQAEKDLRHWTTELVTGRLTINEFLDLLHGEKALATLDALTQAGLAANRCRDFVMD